jgi:subtilase family serine protease
MKNRGKASGNSWKNRSRLTGFLTSGLVLLCLGWCDRALAQVTLNASALQTPSQVLNGTAKTVAHLNASQMVRLVLGLQPPHMADEEQFLSELQRKGSPNYHHFLTADEWNARFAPSVQDEQAVVDWAQTNGFTVTNRYSNRLLVDLEAPSSNIERAFNVRMNTYQLGTRTFFSNDREPTIPPNLIGIVHSIGGLNSLQTLRPASSHVVEPPFSAYAPGNVFTMKAPGQINGDHKKLEMIIRNSASTGSIPSMTGGAYDPTDIYNSQAYDTDALYNQSHCCNPFHNSSGTLPESSIAIATAGTQDTNDFIGFHNQYPYLAEHWAGFTYVDGTPPCCDGEGTMDFEWSTAMSNSFGSYVDTAEIYMYDGANASFATFTDIYNKILTDGFARVFTTSWGCEEINCTPTASMDTDHAIFDSMVGQGWTLFAASGDQGATAGCGDAVAVSYPASDPDVVGAGGTTLSLFSGPIFDYEVGWSGGPDGCTSNDGGSTGGFSSYYATPNYQTSLGFSSRAVPDVSLNADWFNTPQNLYFNGALSGNGGTSIVAPEMAGFFANEEAYLDYLSTVTGGLCNGHGCTPLGNGNYYLYWFGENSGYAPHYPFYDILSGCNDNDITAFYGLGYYCAGSGFDEVTGWGSNNMLQLAWAINTYQAGDFGAPIVTFSGPATNKWYNSDQVVSWTISDTSADGLPATGVAGFSQAWDSDPGDVFSEATPGSGNSFYSGPQYPNDTSGCLDLTGLSCLGGVGQGLHTVNVRTWDNTGVPSGDYTYGPIGYNTVAPLATANLSGTRVGAFYVSPVKVSLSASDPKPGSGILNIRYQVDGGAPQTYVTVHCLKTCK